MGSSARKSSPRSVAVPPDRQRKRKGRRPKAPRRTRPKLSEMLGSIADSISIISTAVRALVGAQERDGRLNASEAGNEIVTLQIGLNRLRHGYDSLEAAFREASDWARAQKQKLAKGDG